MLLSAIVFVLAVGSECLAAQSDRSRHDSRRSGPIRSVPVAADVKRDVDFDCPEEFGYYPHPTDCTLYYVCVFGGALLESCTGGLMYSHELQTCDWPRNVGCDATGAVAAVVTDDVERISERVRDPPPPPRRNPLPPPRVQPNPIVTSRGQPKFNRDEYEKQQQLYAEVDDLPPVEEIESDRQQRVYRGQPSTIGQVQKDRDGYISQVANPGRNVNSNIIPASISQNNGKIGSFSFGTQVEERRIATATQAPQTYRPETSDNATDSLLDVQLDILTNEVHINDVIDKPRHKREIVDDSKANNDTGEMSKRIDGDEEMEYFEIDTEPTDESDEESFQEDSERGKRQIRYYLNNGHKNAGKNWGNSKPVKFIDIQQFNYNPNNQNIRHQSSLNGLHKNNLYDASSKPYAAVNNISPTANTYSSYQNDNTQSQRPFKPSMPDPFNQKLPHNPMNAATQIITKSPPISSLKNNENPFSALAGGFYNNLPKQNANSNRFPPQSVGKNTQNIIRDSYLLPSTVVTGKPVSTVAPIYKKHKSLSQQTNNPRDEQDNYKRPSKQETYDYENASNESGEDESSEENSSEKDENSGKHDFKFDFPDPPYEFTHPSNKYADIENPFANPNFDFDDFLAKLQNDHYSTRDMTTPKSKTNQNAALIDNRHPVEVARPPSQGSENKNSLNYQGMSTPRPFTTVTHSSISGGPIYSNGPSIKIPEKSQQSNFKIPSGNQQSHRSPNEHQYRETQQNAGTPLDAARPKLKPPNFRDDRILPISYNFDRPINTTQRPNYNQTEHKGETQQVYSITQRPYVFVTGTRAPVFLSTPKLQYLVKPGKIVSERPHLLATGKPYLVSTIKPHVAYLTFKPSTSKPLTTLANEQLAVLQQYWRNPSTELYTQSTPRPTAFSNLPKLENLFSQTFRPSLQSPIQNQNSVKNSLKDTATSTTKPPEKRRPIPKPSPEMNDYYYDDNEQYYEPPVKSIYMPSSEVKPQRPPMAQNYQEYDDSDSYEDDDEEITVNITPHQPTYRQPTKNNPESVTKNHNDVSVVTKAPHKESYKNANGKIPVPVMIDLVSPSPTKLNRPEVSNYEIVHHVPRNRTFHIRKPGYNGPNTVKPPKYLNQTTLRPYTVRHRLAKPTTEKEPTTSDDVKQNRGRIRHHNLVAQTKMTTPRDSHNQETRFSKTKHDDKTNSLEPVDNVTPSSYTASPRPKMLYNGSQNYSPDQYDPFYAVYDEDGELYKDTDYVQQYNTPSLRPAVQQTYRGTPPPARRPEPVQYTQRPSADDYDDTLIQGQINNDQNQYQVPVRHSTRPSPSPTNTRGRGSAHYSTLNADQPPQQTNRGTPPTRSRPTLKPSTAIVSKTTEFVDIYTRPPSRPNPVYPQPTPDKTAAKCRKDVCLLPDCYCGGKDIPGDLEVETVPQIVLLTFDDSVNDLNKVLYADLFEKGRVNPNGCPISATFYVSHEWTDYSQVQNLYAAGHEMASHTISHSFGEQFSQKKWNREVGGQREILAAYGGVKLEDVRGMRAPFLSVGGNKMFKMLYDSNFTYDSSMPVYENRPPSWPYTLDYKLFHDCMIPPCPTKSYPGVWEVPMVMWQDLNGGRCSMGDACANPPEPEGVYKMLLKNFDRHYTTNRAPFGLFYHAAWFTQPHHKEGFIMFLDFINSMKDVWIVTNWQALQWVRDPTPINRLNNFQPFQCNYQDRPKKCNNPKVCNLWHKSGVRYMRTCQPCPEIYPWTGKTGIRSSRIDNDIDE
ncbi:chitin deacetylase-like 5 isoform X6 [Choristoneura fumiferana]|uniref:chitin deacetylase-like 5 isoform X6 n=1 Tax=Choristoneura fumiferana TaxID=7141 RepID=UPI003D153F4A